eukprot:Nk52_evm80s230 gene=Nk52_evmTU80s230
MDQVYLDIACGDKEAHKEALVRWERLCGFIQANGTNYGLSSNNPRDLSAEERALARDLYEGNPSFAVQGPIGDVVEEPASLLIGRLCFQLFAKDSPKATENFRMLCSGEKIAPSGAKYRLCYEGCPLHRVEAGFVVQGGDITRGDGSGGESVYGGKFKDDKGGLKKSHNKRGLLSMANSGAKNTNTSQFFVTLAKDPKRMEKLNGKHVVFGELLAGTEEAGERVLARIEETQGKIPIWIESCGVLP